MNFCGMPVKKTYPEFDLDLAVIHFLGNKEQRIIQKLQKEYYEEMGCNMFLEMHSQHSHLEYSSENCEAVSDKLEYSN